MKTKICTKCGIEKELSEFYKDKSTKTGLTNNCKLCRNKYSKKYNDQNRLLISQRKKSYYKNNMEKILENNKIFRANNPDYMKNYDIINREILYKKRNVYTKNKRKCNIAFKLRCYLASRIWSALKSNSKSKQTLELLGCSIEFLKKHLESLFTKGMTWDNYGDWHVDHIKPCALFDLSKPDEQQKCFNYTNLQPLWAIDNLKKADKFIKKEQL